MNPLWDFLLLVAMEDGHSLGTEEVAKHADLQQKSKS